LVEPPGSDETSTFHRLVPGTPSVKLSPAVTLTGVPFPVPGSLSQKYSAATSHLFVSLTDDVTTPAARPAAFCTWTGSQFMAPQCALASFRRKPNWCRPSGSDETFTLHRLVPGAPSVKASAAATLSGVPFPVPGSLSQKYSAATSHLFVSLRDDVATPAARPAAFCTWTGSQLIAPQRAEASFRRKPNWCRPAGAMRR